MTPTDHSVETESVQIPDDFSQFEHWRNTGELPSTPKDPDPAETDPSAASASEPEPARDSDPVETDAEKTSKRGLEKRFSQLTQKIRELEAQVASGKPPAAAADSSNPGVASPKESTEKPQGEPVPTEYKTYDEYVRAIARYELRLEREETARAQAQAKAKEAAVAAQNTWKERVTAIKAVHADFDEVLSGADIAIPPHVERALLQDENGPAVAYHLARHPDDARRIAGLEPVDAVRELGRLSARFDTPSDTPKPKVSSAPAPPKPVAAKAKTEPSIYDETLSYGDWEKLRNAQLKKR